MLPFFRAVGTGTGIKPVRLMTGGGGGGGQISQGGVPLPPASGYGGAL